MHSRSQLLAAAALVGLSVGSPAPQQFDLGEILAAPTLTVLGPEIGAINQTVTINTSSQVASISAAVSTVASAVVTGAAASNAANMNPTTTAAANHKRAVEERDLLGQLLSLVGVHVSSIANAGSSSATSAAASVTSVAAAAKVAVTTSASSTSSAQASSSKSASSSSTSAYFTSMALTSTTSTTTNQGSTTSTSSSTTACPTTPEAGTYCGFINPEDPCAPQPDGNGPKNQSVSDFYAYSPFQSTAASAAVPAGYVNTFNNMNASTSANSYLGLTTLTSYNTTGCAALCDSTTGCTSFNIYIERDPSQNPCMNDSTDATVWGYWCPNPSAITNYKCTLWGSDIDNTTATNTGDWREQFNVVVTGSNGYSKTNVTVPVTVAAYSAPQNCSSKAINGGNYWLGSKFFPGAFDPTLCAAYANATTSCNRQAAINASQSSYTPCNMFNALHVYKNGIPQGTHCRLYDTALNTNWATFQGSWSGHDYYSVRNSWTYSLSTQDKGKC